MLRPVCLAAAVFAGAAQAQLVTLDAAMTADNFFEASVSRSPTEQGTVFLSGSSWPTTYTDSIDITEAGTYYLHVFAQDVGGPEMFIGRFGLSDGAGTGTFSNGTQTLLTVANGDWSVALDGFGGTAGSVVDLGANGVSPWGSFAAMTDARFIWASGGPDLAYFTASFSVVPAPAAGLLGASCLLLGARRR